eukprot:1254458-Prymnesium_polylepis.1
MAGWAAGDDREERAEEATVAVMLEAFLAVMVAILAMVAPAAPVAVQGERAAETEPQEQRTGCRQSTTHYCSRYPYHSNDTSNLCPDGRFLPAMVNSKTLTLLSSSSLWCRSCNCTPYFPSRGRRQESHILQTSQGTSQSKFELGKLGNPDCHPCNTMTVPVYL